MSVTEDISRRAVADLPSGPTVRPGRPRDIALLGGAPAFEDWLLVGRPNVADGEAFLARMRTMLDSRRFANNGPMVVEFEARVAALMAARHCIAACNATIGLELVMNAMGITGEVIVPSFTFIATAHVLQRLNIRPVFCDVDPETHCLDPERVRAAITPRTTAILGVSLWGNYDGERALRTIADEHGLMLIYDSAHSVGCAREHGSDARLCDAEVLSFHATKCIHALEGGAILTDDPILAGKLRLMLNFGFAGEDRVAHIGTNGKMNEAEAAMGLTSLDGAERIFAHNAANLAAYARGLEGVPGVTMRLPSVARHNHQYAVAEVDAGAAGLTRDEIVAALRRENVLARRYFHPGCHRSEPYATLYPDAGRALPETEALCERVMVLPNGLTVSTDDIARLTDRIAAIVEDAPRVRRALAAAADPGLPLKASAGEPTPPVLPRP